MPAYEYTCKDCGKEFIVFLSIKEVEAKPKIKCSHCQSDNVARKLTSFFTKTSKKSQRIYFLITTVAGSVISTVRLPLLPPDTMPAYGCLIIIRFKVEYY